MPDGETQRRQAQQEARSQKPKARKARQKGSRKARCETNREPQEERVKLGYCFLLTSGSWLLASAERHAFTPKQSCSTRLGTSGDCAGPARSRGVDGGGSSLRGQAAGGAANLPHRPAAEADGGSPRHSPGEDSRNRCGRGAEGLCGRAHASAPAQLFESRGPGAPLDRRVGSAAFRRELPSGRAEG